MRRLCRETTISWEDITESVKRGDVAYQLVRSPQVLSDYHAYVARINSEYETMADYVRARYFGFAIVPTENNKKKAQIPDPIEHKIIWTMNEFPYYLEEGIEHHLIWSTQPLTDEHVKQVLEQHVPSANFETVVIQNTFNASIPEVFHLHVFTKKKV